MCASNTIDSLCSSTGKGLMILGRPAMSSQGLALSNLRSFLLVFETCDPVESVLRPVTRVDWVVVGSDMRPDNHTGEPGCSSELKQRH